MLFRCLSIVLFASICILEGLQANKQIQLDEVQGELMSEGHPYPYPSNHVQRYVIQAPENHVIVLKFSYFVTERWMGGLRTDYLQVVDGEKKVGKKSFLYGYKQTPFTMVSKTNKFRLKMVSNGNMNHYRGFRASYQFVNKMDHCNISELNTHEHDAPRCLHQIGGLARKCVARRNGFSMNINCKEGKFVPEIKESIVRQCESNEETACPYTWEEILDYYDFNQLGTDGLSAEDVLAEEESLTNITVIMGHTIGRSQGGRCPQQFCKFDRRRGGYTTPRTCGRIRRRKWRRLCLKCRHIWRCDQSVVTFNG